MSSIVNANSHPPKNAKNSGMRFYTFIHFSNTGKVPKILADGWRLSAFLSVLKCAVLYYTDEYFTNRWQWRFRLPLHLMIPKLKSLKGTPSDISCLCMMFSGKVV